MNAYRLTLAWLLGFVGLAAPVWIDPIARHYGPMLARWWGG